MTEWSQALGFGFLTRTRGDGGVDGGSVSALGASYTASHPKARGGCCHLSCVAETPEPPRETAGFGSQCVRLGAAWLTRLEPTPLRSARRGCRGAASHSVLCSSGDAARGPSVGHRAGLPSLLRTSGRTAT